MSFKFEVGSRVVVRRGFHLGAAGEVISRQSAADENGVARFDDQYEIALENAEADRGWQGAK